MRGAQKRNPGVEGEQQEEEGENIFPFGHPGHGFDAERMDGPEKHQEERGDGTARQTQEERKEEQGVQCMENDVGGMERDRSAGAAAEEGDIGHVGEPEDREPHGGGAGEGEGIPDVLPGESCGDDGVVEDVGGVVEGDEIEAKGGPEEEEGYQEGQDGKEDETEIETPGTG